MGKRQIFRCDGCDKEVIGKEARFWHHLQLTGRDFDSIPPREDVDHLEFCSVACLRKFVDALKVTDSPYAHLV